MQDAGSDPRDRDDPRDEPARLSILAVLHAFETTDFLFLLKQTELSRGNLSSHLSKLEAADYVDITKEFVEKVPRTLVRLAAAGREAVAIYRAASGRQREASS